MYLRLTELLSTGVSVSALLSAALSTPTQLGQLLPSPDNAALLLVLQRLSLAKGGSVTLDINDTDLDVEDTNPVVGVMRRHWGSYGFCLSGARYGHSWHLAANRNGQPLIQWKACDQRAGFYKLGFNLHGKETLIFDALLRVDSTSLRELQRDPTILNQHANLQDPHAIQRAFQKLPGRVPLTPEMIDEHGQVKDAPALMRAMIASGVLVDRPRDSDLSEVELAFGNLVRRRYVIRRGATDRYSIVRPTPPSRRAPRQRERPEDAKE